MPCEADDIGGCLLLSIVIVDRRKLPSSQMISKLMLHTVVYDGSGSEDEKKVASKGVA